MADDVMLLAYLAGCIDCDGFITVSARRSTHRRKDGSVRVYRSWVAIIGLGQITPLIPQLFQATFGGIINAYTYRDRPRSRVAYNWQITNAAAARAINALRPYLRLKTEQADLALEFVARQAATVRGGKPLPPEENEARDALSQRVVALNHGRRWNRPAAPA